MKFDLMVNRIMELTGLEAVEAIRLATANIYLMTGSMLAAASDEYVDGALATMILDIVADSAVSLAVDMILSE